jgi:effector-binding domain-containing protein
MASVLDMTPDQEDISMTAEDNPIQVKDVEAMLVAGIRFRGKYQEVGKAIGRLCRHCGRNAAGKPFSLYHDAEYTEENADIEACIPVQKEVNKAEVKSRRLEGGRAVTLLHHGSYETLRESYRRLMDHVEQNHLAVTTPYREIYLKGPGMIFRGNPKNYLTEIQMMTTGK